MTVRRRLLRVVLVSLLVACASGPPASPPWRIGEEDAGRSIRVPVGTIVDIALPGNPTTGYIWERGPSATPGLEQIGAARFAPDGPAIGQGGLVHLEFRVIGEGATPLVLVYRRPFEKGTPPARSFWVTIVGDRRE